MPVSDDKFEIQFESKMIGVTVRMKLVAVWIVDGGGERVEYVTDINHNTEKNVLKLRKK